MLNELRTLLQVFDCLIWSSSRVESTGQTDVAKRAEKLNASRNNNDAVRHGRISQRATQDVWSSIYTQLYVLSSSSYEEIDVMEVFRCRVSTPFVCGRHRWP
jgi:hypothetical protein